MLFSLLRDLIDDHDMSSWMLMSMLVLLLLLVVECLGYSLVSFRLGQDGQLNPMKKRQGESPRYRRGDRDKGLLEQGKYSD